MTVLSKCLKRVLKDCFYANRFIGGEKNDSQHGCHIYSNTDPDMFVEMYLSQREYKALYKILGEFAKEEAE